MAPAHRPEMVAYSVEIVDVAAFAFRGRILGLCKVDEVNFALALDEVGREV